MVFPLIIVLLLEGYGSQQQVFLPPLLCCVNAFSYPASSLLQEVSSLQCLVPYELCSVLPDHSSQY